jgi:methylglutaconyl-CoA hydratase
MNQKYIEVIKLDRSATIFLNRPEARNAFNREMITEMKNVVNILSADPDLRVMVIRGKNGTFSAGADLKWMKESGSASFALNLAETRLISELMESLAKVPVPLISVTQGAVFGGSMGILGCSDWVLAEEHSFYAFAEVRLGLAPAVVMPYVIGRSNTMKIKQLMLSGEEFDAWEALDAGLVDHIADADELEAELRNRVLTFSGLPGTAVREIKKLWSLLKPSVTEEISGITIKSLSSLKQSDEAQALLGKFLNKKR